MPRRANPNPSPVPLSAESARVWRYLTGKAGEWVSARDIERGADVAFRTATERCRVLEQEGLLETRDIFPARMHRFDPALSRATPKGRLLAEKLNDLLQFHPG